MPSDIRFAEVLRVLRKHGWTLIRVRGSHHVFQRPDGTYVKNSRFHKEVWQPLMGELVGKDLDRKPWIHEIRHAHCTHLLDANVPVHVVQARMGHEDPQTTLRVYARMSTASDAAAADALD